MATDLAEGRPSGKYGALPAQIPAALKALPFYSAGPLAKAPASVAVPSVPAWEMLGNDQYGDCGVAGLEHGFMAVDKTLNVNRLWPDAAKTVSYYMSYTHGQDSGVVLSQYLAYVKKNTYYGLSVEGYAPVSVSDIPTLHFAIWAYDFAYTGISVTKQMEQDFQDHEPWTLSSLDSPVVGGHCIPIVGYDSKYLYAVTWGAIQPIDYSCWHYIGTEAWAVLTGEEKAKGTDGHGINYAALAADLAQLDT